MFKRMERIKNGASEMAQLERHRAKPYKLELEL